MNYCTSNLELVPTSRAAKAAWKARCCEGTKDLSGIPLRIGYNTIGRNFSPGADYLWLGIPAAAQVKHPVGSTEPAFLVLLYS